MKTITPASLFAPLAPAEWEPSTQATLYGPDLDDPWRSVYGFPLAAAQLAAGQKLRLFCREDEIFELLGKLNALLACPTVLNRAYKSGRQLEQAVQCKIERLLERQKLLRTNGRQVGQSKSVTSLEAAGDSSLSRLITPDYPVYEIAGLKQMQSRLAVWLPALDGVKDQGFCSTVLDRRRQPCYPALEMRRNEPVLIGGDPNALEAGFLLPVRYHLTLWAYLVGRSERGQSPIWN